MPVTIAGRSTTTAIAHRALFVALTAIPITASIRSIVRQLRTTAFIPFGIAAAYRLVSKVGNGICGTAASSLNP